MQNYTDTNERQQVLEESIKELERINKRMAIYNVRREELTNLIISALGHEHEGQKSYDFSMWKIEVKTPCVYSLNKRAYESGEFNIPPEYNPVKQSVSYTVDKRKCDELMHIAPDDVRYALIELIDKKPGKASVTIKERIN